MVFSSELIRDEEMMQMKRVLRKRLILSMRRKRKQLKVITKARDFSSFNNIKERFTN
jgi:hypothetical protein